MTRPEGRDAVRTEKRRARSDRSDAGRRHVKAPAQRAREAETAQHEGRRRPKAPRRLNGGHE